MKKEFILLPKILNIIVVLIKHGIFDDNPETSLLNELKGILFSQKGSYAKQIQKVLSAQSPYRLGKYTKNSFGEMWTIIKPLADKMTNLDSLKNSIQDYLSKHGSSRMVDFLKEPLRLVLYYKQPKAIMFSEVEGWMTEKNCFYPFVLGDKLCLVNPEKEQFSHCLISGITGSGKTILMKNFISSLRGESLVFFCNPKNDKSFVEIESLCTEYKVSLTAIDGLIQKVWEDTELRLTYPSSRKIFLFVDELSLVSKESKESLIKIANIGRSLNVHLVLATQRPTKETLPTELKSQMTYTLTGRVSNKREAYYASGIADSGAENLQGSGLFLLNAPGYNNVLVQALLFDSKRVPAPEIEEQEHKESIRDGGQEDMVEVYDYSWDNAPKSVLNRREWVEYIRETKFNTIKEIQDSHELFYGKKLNHKTAVQIKEFLG